MTKPPLTTTSYARPLRVAYIVDPGECPDPLLDSIFAEAYGRWGGRRTLIVPANADGIDSRYTDWLFYFDADVIYSFVKLRDQAVAAIHERFCPGALALHSPLTIAPIGAPNFRIDLPFQALPSLSVISAVSTRIWGFGERVMNPMVIDRFHDDSRSPFVKENFGFLSDSYAPIFARAFPDLFGTLTLISKDALANAHFAKVATAQYVTDEALILEELTKPTTILTLATASDLFAPHFVANYSEWSNDITIVVGDSVDDRLLFWNQHHHRREDAGIGTISALRIPTSRLTDD
jgi:hypothetical protein